MAFGPFFRDKMAKVFLNTNWNAERGRFLLPGGEEVAASVHIGSERRRNEDEETLDRVETIKVLVNKDPAQADVVEPGGYAIGALEHAYLGLRFIRDNDSDPRPFTFTGEVEDERDHKWRLVFQRTRRERQGMRP